LDCVTDDIYTFSKGKVEVAVNYGEVFCSGGIIDRIFKAELEFWSSRPEDATIHLIFEAV